MIEFSGNESAGSPAVGRSAKLLLIGFGVLLTMTACVPATDGSVNQEPQPVQLPAGSTWSAEIQGTQVEYHVVTEFEERADGSRWVADEMNVPMVVYRELGQPCRLEMHTSFLAGTYRVVAGLSAPEVRRDQARAIASLLSTCLLHEVDPDLPVQRTDFGYPELSRWWQDEYLDTCGSLLQPLGIPIGDGDCELPDISSLFLPLDDPAEVPAQEAGG